MNPPCDLQFIAAHPELHHYTIFQGLKGIVETNTIRATHYRDLNDSAEVVHLKERLVEALLHRFDKALHDRYNRQQRRGLKAKPKCLACLLADSLYGATFGNDTRTSSVEAFITSFCTHDKSYDRENGLLSQWRGYGTDGGYCIVFDTAEICDLLAQEWAVADYWGYLHMNTVQYAADEVSVNELFPKLMSACDQYISQVLSQVLNQQAGPSPQQQHDPIPFLASATLFKHQGFGEESEARIVAIRNSQAVREAAARLHDNFTPTPDRTRKNNGRRYVPLFEGLNVKLPIKCVIVGPSHNQARNCALARELLGSSTPVSGSDTPFVGRPESTPCAHE